MTGSLPFHIFQPLNIERFHSRGQHLCYLLKQNKAFAYEKSSSTIGLARNTNMAAGLLFWNTNMAAVTSCENALYLKPEKGNHFGRS